MSYLSENYGLYKCQNCGKQYVCNPEDFKDYYSKESCEDCEKENMAIFIPYDEIKNPYWIAIIAGNELENANRHSLVFVPEEIYNLSKGYLNDNDLLKFTKDVAELLTDL